MNSRIKYRIRGTVKKMNFVSSIYWKFFYCPAALQMKLSELPDVSELTDYHIVSLSKYSPLFDDYVQFINISYEEKVYSKESLSVLLENHHYLKDIQTYLLLDNNGCIVGTISAGVYKGNEQWGGILKFATEKKSRRNGLGLYLLQYGYNTLKKRGCIYGESIVSDRNSRIASLMTHFKCGFTPQTDRTKVQFSICRGKYNKLKGWLTNKWLMKYYAMYVAKHNA